MAASRLRQRSRRGKKELGGESPTWRWRSHAPMTSQLPLMLAGSWTLSATPRSSSPSRRVPKVPSLQEMPRSSANSTGARHLPGKQGSPKLLQAAAHHHSAGEPGVLRSALAGSSDHPPRQSSVARSPRRVQRPARRGSSPRRGGQGARHQPIDLYPLRQSPPHRPSSAAFPSLRAQQGTGGALSLLQLQLRSPLRAPGQKRRLPVHAGYSFDKNLTRLANRRYKGILFYSVGGGVLRLK